jgi:hypothetical protein
VLLAHFALFACQQIFCLDAQTKAQEGQAHISGLILHSIPKFCYNPSNTYECLSVLSGEGSSLSEPLSVDDDVVLALRLQEEDDHLRGSTEIERCRMPDGWSQHLSKVTRGRT